MNKNNFLSILAIVSIILATVGCNKDDDNNLNNNDETGRVAIAFNYVWGVTQEEFNLNTQLTHTRTQEELAFSTFKFYVSNLKLKKDDGSWWVHPESYFIVDAFSESRSRFTLSQVPVGNYTEMEYTLGVDSSRNVSGAQTGALAISNNMFWSWNTGYIMVMAEGNEATEGLFAYHLGGFSGSNKIVTVKNADFGGSLTVLPEGVPTVKMVCNPARLWHTIDGIAEVSSIMSPGLNAVTAATDFYGSVNFVEIEN
jgi:hypothetical protein